MNIIIAGYICIKSRSERWQIRCNTWNWWWVGNDWCQDALCYHSRSEVWWGYQHHSMHNQLLKVLIKFWSIQLGSKSRQLDNQVRFSPSSIFQKSTGFNTPSSQFFSQLLAFNENPLMSNTHKQIRFNNSDGLLVPMVQ